MKPLVNVGSEKLTLNFHHGQLNAWDSRARFVFILAGTQSGKTSFGPWWLWREVYGDGNGYKGAGSGDYLAVTANYDLFKLKMLPEMRYVFEQVLNVGRYHPSDRVIELKNPKTGQFDAEKASDPMWARIILRSAAAGAKKGKEGAGGLESATAAAAWLDECGLDEFSLQAWEAVLRRLSLSQGRILGTTTLYNLGWMKHEVYERWEAGDLDFDVHQFDSITNPAFPRPEYERARRTLPAWKFRMMYQGQYDRPAGMIYHDFDEHIHLIKPFEIPVKWARYVGIDPGPIHTATIWLAEDVEHDCYYLYRETLEGNMTSKQHAQKVKERAEGERVIKRIGGSKSEKQFRLDWQEAGVNVQEPSISDVEVGIDRVIGLLKEKRLFIFDTCRGILDEIGSYSRKLDEKGEPTEVIRNKGKYHRLDALRYIAIEVTKGRRTAVPVEMMCRGHSTELPGFYGFFDSLNNGDIPTL